MRTILLLIGSNVFMITAWYWHARVDETRRVIPFVVIILISWLIALPEYCLAVPANYFGSTRHGGAFTEPQLKIIQEAVTLTVFVAFSLVYLRQVPRWQDFAGMGLILCGLGVALWPRLA
jgi:uncharacterized protein